MRVRTGEFKEEHMVCERHLHTPRELLWALLFARAKLAVPPRLALTALHTKYETKYSLSLLPDQLSLADCLMKSVYHLTTTKILWWEGYNS